MKRYLLFAGDVYYPRGWPDFKDSYDALLEAKATGYGWVWGDPLRWFQVVDTQTLKIVFETKGSPQ